MSVIVTGAASGIGSAFVKKCIDDGAMIIAYDKDYRGLQRQKEQYTDNFHSEYFDISNISEVKQSFEKI